MQISQLVDQNAIILTMRANSKKQCLQMLASEAEKITNLQYQDIFDTLIDREKLGATGVGNGVAIPHGKFEDLDQQIGIFACLEKPIDFDSADQQPVDLVFLLLVPAGEESEHLKSLSSIARIFSKQEIADQIRSAKSQAAIHALMTDTTSSHAA